MRDFAEHQAVIVSEFASDPDMAELVDLFVEELPERVGQIRGALADADAMRLRTIAHQLKGAAPGYGFACVGEAAAQVEALLREREDAVEVALGELSSRVDRLVKLCGRVVKTDGRARPAA